MNWTPTEEQSLLQAALALEPGRRESFLAAGCGDDSGLRRRIEELIAASAEAEVFFSESPDIHAGINQGIPNPSPSRPSLFHETVERIGPYRLLHKLGEGGCGVVYLAEQEDPVRRQVALKVIKLGMDTRSVIARFEAERQALAMMDHPNIARVLEAGATETGRPYFVMELVPGVRITEYCDRNSLSTGERLGLFIAVCHAIQHAHQKGIIHRDIKPSNVLVTVSDGRPVPKVIDFGIAKAIEGRLTEKTIFTRVEQFIGTPAYMSPEQAVMMSQDIDTRSDIYGLGVLLYELLTGKTPFDTKELLASGWDEMRRTISEREPLRPSLCLSAMTDQEVMVAAGQRSADPSRLIRLLRGDLDWIVIKALEKDRTRRYESASGLAADIRRHLDHEPVLAGPPGPVYWINKMVRRNRLIVGALTAVGLTLLGATTISTRLLLGERQARVGEAGQRRAAEMQKGIAEANARQSAGNALHSQRLVYDADMNLAQQAVRANNLGLARRLLDRHRPGGKAVNGNAGDDLRGWEWRYLWQQCRSDAESRICRLDSGITSLGFCPDGDRLVVTTLGGGVGLWSFRTHQPLAVLVTNQLVSQAWEAAVSPISPVVAYGTRHDGIVVADLARGTRRRLPGGVESDYRIAFSPDGRHLAALVRDAGWDGRILVWDTEGYEACRTTAFVLDLQNHYAGGVIRWSADSRSLWIGEGDRSNGNLIKLDGISDPPRRSLTTHPANGLSSLAFSPDGLWLATGAGFTDPTVGIHDAGSGGLVRKLEGHTAYIGALAFSPDGRLMASGSADQTIRLWDTAEWREISVFKGHGDEIHALVFSPDGTRLISGGRDGDVLVWNTSSRPPRRAGTLLPPTARYAEALPGGKGILARLRNGNLVLIDPNHPAAAPEQLGTGEAFLMAPGFVARPGQSNQLVFLDYRSSKGRVLGSIPGSLPSDVDYSPSEHLFAVVWESKHVTCLGLEPFGTGFEMMGVGGALQGVRFSGDGRLLVGRDDRGNVLLWDIRERRLRHSFSNAVDLQLIVPPDNRVLVTTTPRPRQLVFRELGDPRSILDRISLPEGPVSLSCSGDGRWLAVSLEDKGSVDLFRLKDRTLEKRFQRHLLAAHGTVFSPDNVRLASCGDLSEGVKLWDVETGQELISLGVEVANLYKVQFSDDGSLILAGRPGFGSWHFWRAPSWEEIAASEKLAGDWGRDAE